MRKANYDKFPVIDVPAAADACVTGWDAIAGRLEEAVARVRQEKGHGGRVVLVVADGPSQPALSPVTRSSTACRRSARTSSTSSG